MSDYTIDWSNTNIDGNNTATSGSGSVGFTVSTPENVDHDQWMKGTVHGVNGLKAWDVNDPTKVKIDFDQDATNVSFDLLDVDGCDGQWDDRVTVIAKDANGNILPVTFSDTASGQHVNGNRVDASNNGNLSAGDNGATIGVFIAGPVASLEIVFDNGSGANISGSVGLSDIHFDAAATEDGYVDGTSGNDTIIVNAYEDSDGDEIDDGDAILPGEGADDDIVLAGGGNDLVMAQDGDDEVYGGSGDDTLCGQDGDDVLYGEGGNDILEGMNDDDVMFGGSGSDTIYGDAGDDVATGGTGSDKMYGGTGEDLLSGAKGNDVIKGGADDDEIYGGGGSDSIEGGAGDDILIGGNMAYDGTQDFNELSAGELIEGQYIGEGMTITSGDPKNPVMVFDSANPTGGDSDLHTGNLGKVLILSEDRDGSDPDDNASGGTFNINFEGPADVSSLTLLDVEEGAWVKYYDVNGNLLQQVDVTTANNGQHVVNTNLSNVGSIEVILGGSGAIDNITYAINPDDCDTGDVISGGEGDDYIEGNAGDDELSGGAGADQIFGGDGSDLILGGAGDTVDGGATGSDHDVLDLTGQGAFYLAGPDGTGAPVSDTETGGNGNGINGTVIFVDGDGNPTGETLSFTDIEEIIGDEVNRGPDAQDDTATVDEDGSVDIDVLGNDSDPDGDDLEVVSATSPNGTVTINPDGTLTFEPDENFNGETTITYTIDDGNGGTDTATVTVTVNPVNDDPVANDDAASTDEDTPVDINVLGNDTDVDGDDLEVTDATSPDGDVVINGDGTITFTPDPDFNGETTITYTISDGNGGTDTATVTVTVGSVNDGPDAVNDSDTTDEDTPITVDLLANDSDPEGDDLEVVSATLISGEGTITDNGDGTVTFEPAENWNGEAVIEYTISDGNGGEDTAQHTITVTPVNDAPEANDDSDVTDFNTPVTVDLLANDTDVDGDDLTVVSATVPADQGSLVDNGDGTVTFTPAIGFTGEATISYTIEDEEGLQDSATHIILVEAGIIDGTVDGTSGDDLIDGGYLGDPEGDRVDNDDAILPGDVGDDDLIYGYEGDDTILAGAGDDEVYGGEGDDSILGQGGFDTLSGDDGNDTITGGRDNDTIFGGNDDDVLDGDSGDDSIEGNAGDDSILGGGGDDIIRGGQGNDTIDGENNDDMIFGGAGDDSLAGGDGDDKIEGGSGDDIMEGGRGNDDLWGASGDDSVDGGLGNDTINTAGGNDIVEGGDGNDIIDTGNDQPDALPDVGYPGVYPADTDPNNDLDTVYGGAGNDTISTGDDNDTIFGGEGRDVIDAGIDDDLVYAGADNDTVIGSEGNDEIYGEDGNDTIYGGLVPGVADGLNLPDDIDLVDFNNNDTLFGGDGNDTIYGADDDDTLYGDDGDDTLIGGVDEDEQYGGFGNDTFIVDEEGHGAGDVIVGGEDPDGNDVDVLDLTGSNVDFITYEAGDPEAGVVTFLDGSTLTFSEIENVIPCFTPGTTIATPKGERLVEDLREGDRIITRDNGIQEIRWVGRKEMSGKQLVANPHLKPVLIRAGSLGNGLPERDMLVSPNHRMLVASEKTQLYFEEREVLAAAKHLVGTEGIHSVDVMGTSYIHFMFDRHEVVLSNGAWTESFQPGDYSLKGIGNGQRNEIFELFPELATKTGLEGYQSARRALKKHEAKLLVK